MDSETIIEREKEFINNISDKYNYDDNIKHLLLIIIPAFIIKYGIDKEKLVKDTFENIKIIKSDKKDKQVKAYYSSIPKIDNNEFKTVKYMVIQNYNNISLIDLLENLVHEFNHAINSYINEIKVTKNYLYLRTGLTYRVFNKESLEFIRKDSSYLLEEIINTKQTEDVINIIKKFNPNDSAIYAINSETSNKFNSNAYYLQSYITKDIIENRTFISTLEKLRLTGDVYDLKDWFDNITGKKGSYKELNVLLEKTFNLETEYIKKKFFKFLTLNKIKDNLDKIRIIINEYNQNVNFK